MFNVGGAEILVLLVIALMVLGPDRLPQAARQVGKMVAEFRRATSGVRREIEESMSINDLRKEVDDLRSAFDIKRVLSDDGPTPPAGSTALDTTMNGVATSSVAAPDGSPAINGPATQPTQVGSPSTAPVRDVLAD